MTRSTAAKLAAVALIATAAAPAFAQVQAYHHRSTVFGDHAAGLGELYIGQGLNARYNAEAYQTLVRAERDRYLLGQLMLDGYYQEEARKESKRVALREENLRERAAREGQTQAQGLDAVSQIRNGTFQWPALLTEAEYAPVRERIEDLVRAWPVDLEAATVSQRAGLVHAINQMQEMIRNNATGASFTDQTRAMKVAKSLGKLPYMEWEDGVRLASR